eukprot:g12285.t1
MKQSKKRPASRSASKHDRKQHKQQGSSGDNIGTTTSSSTQKPEHDVDAGLAQLLSGPALKQAKKQKQLSVAKKINGPDEGRKLLPRTQEERKSGERVVVVLEKCFLELVQVRKGTYELLNSDDHKTILMKNEKRRNDVAEARPDITHQCLMTLLDSPLNKKGKLLIYLHTRQNVLIEVHPSLRVPRTFKRFCGLMVELLQKNKIRAAQTNEILMKVISNPIEKYLPPGGRKVGLSVSGSSVNVRDYCKLLVDEQRKVAGARKQEATAKGYEEEATTGNSADGNPSLPKQAASSSDEDGESDEEDERPTMETAAGKFLPITFVVGAVAHCDPVSESGFGLDYVSDKVSISPFGLSASCVCAKLTHEFEMLWGI